MDDRNARIKVVLLRNTMINRERDSGQSKIQVSASEAAMTNKKYYGLLLVGALILIPDSVLADTGSSSASYQTPSSSYTNSLNEAYRQSIGTSRSVANKATNNRQVSSTLSSSAPNSGAFLRPGAFQYRQGYQHKTKCRKVNKNRPGLPGHDPSAGVPELDASVSQSAWALLIGSVLVLRARKRRNK